MKKIRLLAFPLLFSGLGCGPAYLPMASHTLDAGENQQVDVIWVQKQNDELLRCSNSAQGPVCTRVTSR